MTVKISEEASEIENSRQALLDRLATLGIRAPIVPYPAHSTVEEGKARRGEMAGTFTKNLLLKDKRDRFFLLAIHEDRVLDLKLLPSQIGAHRRVSFASPAVMQTMLGVEPGALTPLALLNADGWDVSVILDAALLTSDQVNFHPIRQTESIGLKPADLLEFIRSTRREPIVVEFDSEQQANPAIADEFHPT